MCDRKLLIGIGIGMILSTLIMSGAKWNHQLSKAEIEKKAMELGMKYEKDMKVIFEGDVKK